MIGDCRRCGSRIHLTEAAQSEGLTFMLACPACGARGTVTKATAADVCDARFPDAADTRCLMRPHAAAEHDPEHTGYNPVTHSVVTWRASEYGP